MEKENIITYKMGGYDVYQRTQDGMFNATSLVSIHNSVANSKKRVTEFFRLYDTTEITRNINLQIKDIYSKSKGKETWVCIELFYLLCNWLSPITNYLFIKHFIDLNKFKEALNNVAADNSYIEYSFTYVMKDDSKNNLYKLGISKNSIERLSKIRNEYSHTKLLFVIYGNLEKELHEKFKDKNAHRDNHNEWFYLSENDILYLYDLSVYYEVGAVLYKAINVLGGADYPRVIRGLNYIVFGIHTSELRQSASPQQLKSLTNLQEKLAFAINMGYIKSFDELLNEMRRIYRVRDQYLAL